MSANIATGTKPMAIVKSDGTPMHTTVVLVLEDGQEIDLTASCRGVTKEAGYPAFIIEIIALCPRDEIERELRVHV